MTTEERALRAEIERLRSEGSPGVMHDIDRAFYELAVKERDYERARADRLAAELKRGATLVLALRQACRAANSPVVATPIADALNALAAWQRGVDAR